ncbi:histidine--tRNA ligase [Candidatus Saccharibacteria bacterium]|nr:histidine--tRNA ligase [Candidatus Saccharibacteria bacterium]
MALSTQPYKGARDFYPEDKRLQNYIFGVMHHVARLYGYEEYDAPILEPTELYTAKTSNEIVNEQTYSFTDRGGRSVTIRPEMTPSVSRMVAAKRQELAYPLRWYSIPNVWRYERPQRGRLREHWQLNVDLFGMVGLEAEQEIIQLADHVMRAFKAKRDMYSIKINSRRLIHTFVEGVLGLDDVQTTTLIRLIDHLPKMDQAEFVGQAEAILRPSQRTEAKLNQLLAFLKAASLEDLPSSLRDHESTRQLSDLLHHLDKAGVTNVQFDPTLMRGFDYYTDVVFEVYDTHPDNNRSMFGGGRYDGLVGLFGVEPLPTIGFGMGDVTMANFLQLHDLVPELRAETEVLVIPIGDAFSGAQRVAAELRQMGLNTALGASDQKADKQIKTALKKGVKYAVFIGSKELESEQFVLKDLDANNEESHSLQRIVSIVKDYRER